MKFPKIILAFFLCVVLVLATAGCSGSSDSSITMGTGGTTGTYYAFGSVLSDYMAAAAKTRVNVVSTDGSAANIYGIDDGLYQLGTVQSDVMAYAFEGSRSFEADGAIDSFLTIGGLYEEAVQIVTLDESIKTVSDLKGKAVSIGAPGSGVYFNAIDVLGAYGMTEADIRAEYLAFGDSTDAMKDGKIDAAFIVAGAPTNAVSELAATNRVYLVSIDDAAAENLIAACPYYNRHTISSDVYGTQEDISTVSIKATLIVSADTDDDVVYNLTASIFDNIEAISKVHAKGLELSIENATSGITVPFHPGAAKYFLDNGVTVPSR